MSAPHDNDTRPGFGGDLGKVLTELENYAKALNNEASRDLADTESSSVRWIQRRVAVSIYEAIDTVVGART